MDNLTTLIQKHAGTFKQDVPKIYICEVLSVNKDDRTCSVKALSGLAIESIDDFSDKNFVGDDITESEQNKINAAQNALVFDDVALQAGGCVTDGYVIFPIIGSQVTILHSRYEQAFVIQYSEVDDYQIVSGGTTTTINKNFQVVTENSNFAFKDEECSFSVKGQTKYDQTDSSVSITTPQATFKQDTKFTMKNNAQSLAAILKDMIDVLQSITYTNGAGAAGFTPASLPLLTALKTRVDALMNS